MQQENVVVITGINGLIGRELCQRLGSFGLPVIGLDRHAPPYSIPNTEFLFADVNSDESMQNAFHLIQERFGTAIETVIHFPANNLAVDGNARYRTMMVESTKRLFRELGRFAVGQFIFASTMFVHAPTHPGQRINEQSPLKPMWDYPRAALRAERVVHELHGEISTVILRAAGVYSDICESPVLAHQIQRIFENQITSHVYPGDVNAGQAYVHIDDLVDAIVLAMNKRERLGPIATFLIGESDTITYDDLQREISFMIYGADWQTRHVPKPLAKAGAWLCSSIPLPAASFIKPWMVDRADDNYELSNARAEQLLGWEPKHSLRTALPRMIENLFVDPIHWYKINNLKMPSWLKSFEREERRTRYQRSA